MEEDERRIQEDPEIRAAVLAVGIAVTETQGSSQETLAGSWLGVHPGKMSADHLVACSFRIVAPEGGLSGGRLGVLTRLGRTLVW